MTYATATKRSITIAGHEASIRLEPAFWQALERAGVVVGGEGFWVEFFIGQG